MVRDILLILLGIDIGTASPHLAVMANATITRDSRIFMNELKLAWPSFVVEAVVVLIILFFLHRIDETNEKKRREREDQQTAKIVCAIKAPGEKLDSRG